jgi:hypothetical protein
MAHHRFEIKPIITGQRWERWMIDYHYPFIIIISFQALVNESAPSERFS